MTAPVDLSHLPLHQVIMPTGRGSDYWGNCDQCGKYMSEAYKIHAVYVHPDGRHLRPHAMAYGHEQCLRRFFDLVDGGSSNAEAGHE